MPRHRAGGTPDPSGPGTPAHSGPVFEALRGRRSRSSVGESAPTHEELVPLVAAVSRLADHGGLRPWRIVEIRGGARERLGAAMDEAAGDPGSGKHRKKTHRASLLVAVVVVRTPSRKAPDWEQEAVAAGVAHALTLLLEEQGWGVFWRTGSLTRSEPVRRMHGLRDGEDLLGWLYVGDAADDDKGPRPTVDGERMITVLD
ncbi:MULTISPECIES: nitroreductase family protein [Clavibacter]|uniref:Putative NAD(P)H nitroreductase n=2 Tax=Clavibacter TaxID=1573 RepID=A0A399NXH4_9MICO|nr:MULTISPECIES: nitroreductase family protein [Clavibacter]RII98863.1 nitroreductase [Clavibacter michiganensis]UKF26625.1 nitroreductase family protein [Clavibacter sp. A6099]